jgi:hypothetical protein
MAKNKKNSDKLEAETRLLLTVWDLGGIETPVKKSEINKRIQRSKEKAADYQSFYDELHKSGDISLTAKGQTVNVCLTEKGIQMLEEGLKNPDFLFNTNVGAKTVNALLKWIRQTQVEVAEDKTGKNNLAQSIKSYKEFEQVSLQIYNQLNSDYKFDNLVPIYRIRREIGESVTRENFNEWILEMQAVEIFQLQGGSLPDGDSAKYEDSITTEIGGLRCYAKYLK